MGKKKPSTFDYFTGSGKLGKAMDRYDVKPASFGGRPGEYGGGDLRDRVMPEDIDREIIKAANNDYDTRRTMEAQAMAGKKKAEKYAKNGFNSVTDVLKANNMMSRWHKNQGNGGDFSSASDFAGLTYNSVERDRAKQTAGYEKMFATKDELNDAMSKVKSADEQAADAKSSYKPSDRLKNARARVGGYLSSSQDASTAGDNQEQRTEAANSFSTYKAGLKRKKNFRPTL